MSSSTQALMSALAANRAKFFELVAAVEKQADCHVDEVILTGLLDSEHDGKTKLTKGEANALLFACTSIKRKRS